MIRLKYWLPALAVTLAFSSGLRAEPGKTPTTNIVVAQLDPAALAAKIDHFAETRWALKKIQPAPIASDGEFLRRVYLDLTGRIPRVSEVRDFLDDKSPEKRARLIEALLDNPRHVMHMSNSWRSIMLPANNDQQVFFSQAFKTWVDKQVQSNTPYDQMVRELLIATVNFNGQGRNLGGGQPFNPNNVSPIAFYQANEFKAENLAAATSRVFLGVRLECAQCHDHPFARWSKNQFWEYAAFFSAVQPRNFQPKKQVQPPIKLPNGREITIPGTEKVVEAKFLDGKVPAWKDDVDSRITLADWFVSADNPYFAQTGANRIWAHFFGIGIIDPVDDEPTEENPSSHPELLAELTQQFIAHKFDVKYLMRAITLSKTYQRSSIATDKSQNEPRLFARMAVKGMSPEQLFDSLALATGYQEGVAIPNQRGNNPFGQGNARAEFISRFATQDKKTETQTSILQALAMMNGKFVADATSLDKSNTLGAVLDMRSWTDAQRIETLYLATLSRSPRQEEAERMLKYVSSGGPRNDSRAAMADVFWVLLNSSEFMLNH